MSVKRIKRKMERRGRPEIDDSLKKNNIAVCCFTKAELKEVTRAASLLGVSRSRFLAEAALKRSARVKLKVAAKK